MIPRCLQTFMTLRDDASSVFFDFNCGLAIGEDREFKEDRARAYCEKLRDGTIVIYVSRRLEQEPIERIEGVLRHEIGHAVDFLYPGEMLDEDMLDLPQTPERRADELAFRIWGDVIAYDVDDLVQTIGSGLCPRPAELGL